jgi:hypothetical protein
MRTCSRTLSILGRQAKLGPRLPLCYSGVDYFAVRSEAYPSGGLDLLAVVIVPPGHDRLGSVLVGRCGICGELVGGIIEIFIISPVRATVERLEKASGPVVRGKSLLC